MVAISSSVSDGSSLNLETPTLRSICHGGITRVMTFSRIERAHGRASLYVSSDMGAMEPGRWQFWHAFWKIGAMSLEKVGSFTGESAAKAIVAHAHEMKNRSRNIGWIISKIARENTCSRVVGDTRVVYMMWIWASASILFCRK